MLRDPPFHPTNVKLVEKLGKLLLIMTKNL